VYIFKVTKNKIKIGDEDVFIFKITVLYTHVYNKTSLNSGVIKLLRRTLY